MQQTWKDLLFVHYKIPAARMQPLIPKELELDTYEGDAWLGITPFKMRNVRFRGLPPVPTAWNFLELNVRTYVKVNGKSGVYFFSLDSSSSLSVIGARLGVFLHYFASVMSVREDNGVFHFKSHRKGGFEKPVVLDIKYKPVSEPAENQPGTLESWLTERYCLFQPTVRGRALRIDIHHTPWILQQAEADILENNMTEPFGLILPERPPLLHFSKILKTLIWSPRSVAPA